MEGNDMYLEEAFNIQLKVLPDSEELSISGTRSKSPDKALEMAGFIHKHLIENAGCSPEFKSILKEAEKFGDDKIKVVGFFYETLGIDGGQISIGQLKEVANGWKLGDKFDKLVETFFTGQPMEVMKVMNKN